MNRWLKTALVLLALTESSCTMSDTQTAQKTSRGEDYGQDFVSKAEIERLTVGPDGQRDPEAVPLYEAIFSRDAPRVDRLLSGGRSPDRPLYPGQLSPLATAIALNDGATVDVLSERGADLNRVSGLARPGTPLALALRYGVFYEDRGSPFAIFHRLLTKGANVNAVYGNERDVASDTLTWGRTDLTNVLLDHGFRHDLPGLRRVLDNLVVEGDREADRKRAIEQIDRLLNERPASK